MVSGERRATYPSKESLLSTKESKKKGDAEGTAQTKEPVPNPGSGSSSKTDPMKEKVSVMGSRGDRKF